VADRSGTAKDAPGWSQGIPRRLSARTDTKVPGTQTSTTMMPTVTEALMAISSPATTPPPLMPRNWYSEAVGTGGPFNFRVALERRRRERVPTVARGLQPDPRRERPPAADSDADTTLLPVVLKIGDRTLETGKNYGTVSDSHELWQLLHDC
jgi:hypothetical protein